MAQADDQRHEPREPRAEGWCPRCLRRFPAGTPRCPKCGLVQSGADVDRLRQVVSRLGALESEARDLRTERDALLRAVGSDPARAPVPAPSAGGPDGPALRWPFEWRVETVRDVLLVLGSILLALAALTFSVLAWRRLGDSGRAAILLAATALAVAASALLHRRLPQTAEAMSGVAIAMVLVDWFALRRAGVASGWSAGWGGALGTGLTAAACAGAARVQTVPRVAAALLVQASVWLVLTESSGPDWAHGLAAALLAAILAAGGSVLGRAGRAWQPPATTLRAGAVIAELGALGWAIEAGGTGMAAVLAAAAVAPAVARLLLPLRPDDPLGDGLVALSAGALLGSGSVLLSLVWEDDALAAAVAALGAAAMAAGRLLPHPARRGTATAAGATTALADLTFVSAVAAAVFAPLAWGTDPWRLAFGADAAANLTPEGDAYTAGWPALIALLAAVAAAAAVTPSRIRIAAGVGCAVPLLAVLPLAAGAPAGVALLVTTIAAVAALAAAAWADRAIKLDLTRALLAAAGVLAATSTGWALSTEAGTHVLLTCVGLAAAAVAVLLRPASGWLRSGLAGTVAAAVAVETGAVTVSAGGDVHHVGFFVLVAGGAALVASAFIRRTTSEGRGAEAVGLAAMVMGVGLAATDSWWVAGSLTGAVVFFTVAAVPPAGRFHLWGAAGSSVLASWAWLDAADVRLLEAYTLPAAAVALAAGVWVRRTQASGATSSWLAFAPGLSVGLAPSLALALAEADPVRPLLLSVAALAVLLAGAQYRLQAPIVLGAATLVILAIDTLAPVAAQLPRWLVIGTIGAVLLWLGATAERRILQLRALGRRFQDMEDPLPHSS
jgi:hypothetical protein